MIMISGRVKATLRRGTATVAIAAALLPLTLRVATPVLAGGVRQRADWSSARGERLLYLTVPIDNLINIYRARYSHEGPIAQITGIRGLGGIAVDGHGNLLAYAGAAILEFHRGSTTPFRMLSAAPGGYGLAVDAEGTVYAGGPDNAVRIYDHGATLPTRVIRDPLMMGIYEVAVGRSGVIFCNGSFYENSQVVFPVDELKASSKTSIRLRYLGLVGGLEAGTGNTLVVQDTAGNTVSVYPPPYTGAPVYARLTYLYQGPLMISNMAVSRGADDVWVVTATKSRAAILGSQFRLGVPSSTPITYGAKNATPPIVGGYDGGNPAIAIDPGSVR